MGAKQSVPSDARLGISDTRSAANEPASDSRSGGTKIEELVIAKSEITFEAKILTSKPELTPTQLASSILCILTADRLLENEDVRRVCEIFMGCTECNAMKQMKKLVDAGLRRSNMGSLFHFVFDILLERERKLLLDHFDSVKVKLIAGLKRASNNSNPATHGKESGVVIISDVDDTVVASLKDRRLTPNTLYPGVRAFYLELGTARASDNTKEEEGNELKMQKQNYSVLTSTNCERVETQATTAGSDVGIETTTVRVSTTRNGEGVGTKTGTEVESITMQAEQVSSHISLDTNGGLKDANKQSRVDKKRSNILDTSNHEIRVTQAQRNQNVAVDVEHPLNIEVQHDVETEQTAGKKIAKLSPVQPIIFVTARPGWMRASTSRSLVAHGFIDSVVLTGTTTGFISGSSMINRKVHHVASIKRFYPDHALLFIGDNGQLDIDIAKQLIRRELVVSVFIHDVFSPVRNSRKNIRRSNSELSVVTDDMPPDTDTDSDGEGILTQEDTDNEDIDVPLETACLSELENQEQFIEYGEEEGKMRRKRSNDFSANSKDPLNSGTVEGGEASEITGKYFPSVKVEISKEGEEIFEEEQGAEIIEADVSTLLREYQDESLYVDRYRGPECQKFNIGLFQTYCGAAQLAMQRGLLTPVAAARVALACANDMSTRPRTKALIQPFMKDLARLCQRLPDALAVRLLQETQIVLNGHVD